MGHGSWSAYQVLLVRADLARRGRVDDRVCATFLPAWIRRMLPLLHRLATGVPEVASFEEHLIVRTRFFDAVVRRAVDDGCTQVVVLGAGWDTRAWRLAGPGVRFFEVDLPATQRTKRGKAPSPAPSWIPVDLENRSVAEGLLAGGWDRGQRTVFIAEGLLPYLSVDAVERLLRDIAVVACAGTYLAFLAPTTNGSPAGRWAEAMVARARREPVRSRLTADQALARAAERGWRSDSHLAIGDDAWPQGHPTVRPVLLVT